MLQVKLKVNVQYPITMLNVLEVPVTLVLLIIVVVDALYWRSFSSLMVLVVQWVFVVLGMVVAWRWYCCVADCQASVGAHRSSLLSSRKYLKTYFGWEKTNNQCLGLR